MQHIHRFHGHIWEALILSTTNLFKKINGKYSKVELKDGNIIHTKTPNEAYIYIYAHE